jgi:hypothetical protein
MSYTNDYGFTFDPNQDLIRIVTDQQQNISVDPVTFNVVSTFSDLAYANPDYRTGDPPKIQPAYKPHHLADPPMYAIEKGIWLGHRTGLVKMDASSDNILHSVGTVVDPPPSAASVYLRIGLDFDPDGKALVSMQNDYNPSASHPKPNSLYIVDPTTGVGTCLGEIGTVTHPTCTGCFPFQIEDIAIPW